MTPIEIEQSYENDLRNHFPYNDCRWLQSHIPDDAHELIPDLDTYFSDVAGLASTASRLHERQISQLTRYLPCLGMNFFERFPKYAASKALINSASTPELQRRLLATEDVRRALLPLIIQAIDAQEPTELPDSLL